MALLHDCLFAVVHQHLEGPTNLRGVSRDVMGEFVGGIGPDIADLVAAQAQLHLYHPWVIWLAASNDVKCNGPANLWVGMG